MLYFDAQVFKSLLLRRIKSKTVEKLDCLQTMLNQVVGNTIGVHTYSGYGPKVHAASLKFRIVEY